MLDGASRRVYSVLQSGTDMPRPKKRPSAILKEEELTSEYAIETFEQPLSGWVVDVDEASCQCRTWFKFAYCVHLIAAQVHIGLHVEGVSKKRKFVSKRVTCGSGRRSKVGHALAQE